MELFYSLQHGTFPLYVPGFSMGRTAAALTLGQLYHPLSYVSVLMPGYWQGGAFEWNTFFRLISLGLAHWALFHLFRSMKFGKAAAFLLSFIGVYNLKMLDLFRFGAGLENYTAFIFLSCAIGMYWIKPTRLLGPLCIIGSIYLLVCGGHPQFMYVGLVNAGVLTILFPSLLRFFLNNHERPFRQDLKFYGTVGACALTGVLLSAAYVLPFYADFLPEASSRSNHGYGWALSYSDTRWGILYSYVFPLQSDVNGAFGGSSMVLLSFLFPLLLVARGKVPLCLTATYGVIILILLVAAGAATPVHHLFWQYFPFFQIMRAPGRFTMALPVLSAILLAGLFRLEENRWRAPLGGLGSLALLGLAGIILFVVLHGFAYRFGLERTDFTPQTINGYPPMMDPVMFGLGLATLILLFMYGYRDRGPGSPSGRALLPLIALVIIQTLLSLQFGTWVQGKEPSVSLDALNEARAKSHNFFGGLSPKSQGYGLEQKNVADQINYSFLERRLAQFYRRWVYAASAAESYALLGQRREPDIAVIEQPVQIEQPLRAAPAGADAVRLMTNTFNAAEFELHSEAPGYLVTNFPHVDHWRAYVDGLSAPVVKANGYLAAVFVGTGVHRVSLSYASPAAVRGVMTSCVILMCIGLYAAFCPSLKCRRAAWLTGALVVPVGLFVAWSNSLYRGHDLNTVYEWTSHQFPPRDNLAFGKATWMSSYYSILNAFAHNPGNGIDHDYETCFKTGWSDHESPWWEIDLGEVHLIKRLELAENRSVLTAPMNIYVSGDGTNYRQVPATFSGAEDGSRRTDLDPTPARFVKLKSSDPRKPLSLCEVEVYR